MNEWTTKTLQRGSCTIVLRRPMLTQTERDRREQAVRESLECVLREYVKRKECKT